jgi:hypothetical protein
VGFLVVPIELMVAVIEILYFSLRYWRANEPAKTTGAVKRAENLPPPVATC